MKQFTIICATLVLIACGGSQEADAQTPASTVPAPSTLPDRVDAASEAAFYLDAARVAWEFVDRNDFPETGLTKATEQYSIVTQWDVSSVLAAYLAAWKLGFIDQQDFRTRVGRAFDSLEKMPLFDRATFHKSYHAQQLRMWYDDKPTDNGHGFSATDIGRLLIWLKIIPTHDPTFAAQAQRIVDRMDFSRLVGDGYIRGQNVNRRGEPRTFQEGRLGYEQYAATGFALWGQDVKNALDVWLHSDRADVLGQEIMIDTRGMDRLTSEPFVLMGMEVGWTPGMREAAWRALAAQKARWEQTKRVTMVSEDAIPVAPYYFYYYNIWHDGKPFTIDAEGAPSSLDEPRWVSTKASLAWHALLPDAYTWLAVQTVKPAMIEGRGWDAGVFEKDGRPVGNLNVNTAGIVLEAAMYYMTGKPLLYPSVN